MNHRDDLGVLFLCMGNICRSPLAEGAFRASLTGSVTGRAGELQRLELEGRLRIDSAGTGGWHAGEPPDPRSVRVAREHGVDISGQRARQLTVEDFERFDWIVAMDEDNLAQAERRRPPGARARLVQFVDFVPVGEGPSSRRPDRVPDPYYGELAGFVEVWRLLQRGMGPLIEAIARGRTP